MPFTIEQTSALELSSADGSRITVAVGELRETGEHELLKKVQFKDDREEWMVRFTNDAEKIVVEVTYSTGIDGHDIIGVAVVKVPDGFEIDFLPNFETQEA